MSTDDASGEPGAALAPYTGAQWADFAGLGVGSSLLSAGIMGSGVGMLWVWLRAKYVWRDLKAKYPTLSAHRLLAAYVSCPGDPDTTDLVAFTKSKNYPRARGGSPAQRRYRRLLFHKMLVHCAERLDEGDLTLKSLRQAYQAAIAEEHARRT